MRILTLCLLSASVARVGPLAGSRQCRANYGAGDRDDLNSGRGASTPSTSASSIRRPTATFLADRSKQQGDRYFRRQGKNRFIGRGPAGFCRSGHEKTAGRSNNSHSGPERRRYSQWAEPKIWAGDGDSTIKVFDAKTMKLH